MQGISELITEPSEINIDFADVRTVMKGTRRPDGIGIGEGANALLTRREAINNPLLENASIEGRSVLVNLAGGDGLTLQEYQDVVELITENCAEDALIIAGQAYNPELGEKIKVTVVATGFVRPSTAVDTQLEMMDYKRMKTATTGVHTAATQEGEDIVTVNRWQDLQQQLGRQQQTSDYNFPAVLRYQQGDDDDNGRPLIEEFNDYLFIEKRNSKATASLYYRVERW